MKDNDRQVLPSRNGDADLPEKLWSYDDFMAEEDQPVTDFAAGLVTLGFIKAALRRCAWFWCTTAVVGFVCGIGVAVAAPPAYQASTSVLLTHNSSDNAVDAMQTDLALADSHSVAERTIQKLGLKENVDSFVAAEAVTPITDRVLNLTVSATSPHQAVVRVSALAAEFLQFRAQQLQNQQQLVLAGLDQQISQARENLSSISAQISQVSAQPASAAQRATLSRLNSQHTDAVNALNTLEQTTDANRSDVEANILTEIKGSQVLDPAASVHHSALKFALIYAAVGLVVGLGLGMAIVVIRALVSDRLRRRDDIADALGGTVHLSVGRIHAPRWHLQRPKLKAARNRDMARIVAYLRDAVPESSSGAAALAIVPVDNEKSVAQSLVSLAASCAQQGHQVLVADLCPGAPAAHLLGAANPGLQKVTVDGVPVDVAVGDCDDVTPTGPVHPGRMRTPEELPGEALAAAYHSADILLTLIALDPSLGAEHLRTWAADAVVVVTAGRSSWLRIHGVGEMIRLARVRLVSAVLVGADKTDESLGITQTAEHGSGAVRTPGLSG